MNKTAASPVTIWKFPFPFGIDDVVEIEMPGIPDILYIEWEHGGPCIWAVVNPAAAKVIQRLRLFGTGHLISEKLGRYVGTFRKGAFYWHVFEDDARKEIEKC